MAGYGDLWAVGGLVLAHRSWFWLVALGVVVEQPESGGVSPEQMEKGKDEGWFE